MPQLTFKKLAQKVLDETRRAMSPKEIWIYALEKSYDQELQSRGATPEASIGATLYLDVRDNPRSLFLATETRPKRFYIRGLDITVLDDQPSTPSTIHINESQMHPFLTYFASKSMRVFTNTVVANRGSRIPHGEWAHPDMIGVYFDFTDIKDESVLEVGHSTNSATIKLFSFELKTELNSSNVREHYFQAVSNSSWANEGYLVTAEITSVEDDPNFRSELERLCSAFGIGIIKLHLDSPESSSIFLPARCKSEVDLRTLAKIAANSDVKDFLIRVNKSVRAGAPISGFERVSIDTLLSSVTPT